MIFQRSNLLRAIEFGLKTDSVSRQTTELILQLYPLIERRGYWAEWIPVLQAAIASARTEARVRLQLQNQLGFIYRLNRQLSDAIEIEKKVIAEAGALDYRPELAEAHLNLGNAYLASHEYDRARSHGQKALQLFAELNLANNARKIASAHNLLGQIEEAQGRYDQAVVFYRLEDWQMAEQAFRQANSTYLQKSGNYYLQAFVYNNLGHIFIKQNRPRQAAEFLRESVRFWRMAGDDLMLGNTLGALGGALAEQNKTEEALAAFEEALQLLERFPDNAWARERVQEYKSQRQAIL